MSWVLLAFSFKHFVPVTFFILTFKKHSKSINGHFHTYLHTLLQTALIPALHQQRSGTLYQYPGGEQYFKHTSSSSSASIDLIFEVCCINWQKVIPHSLVFDCWTQIYWWRLVLKMQQNNVKQYNLLTYGSVVEAHISGVYEWLRAPPKSVFP